MTKSKLNYMPLFNSVDIDGDGLISTGELYNFLRDPRSDVLSQRQQASLNKVLEHLQTKHALDPRFLDFEEFECLLTSSKNESSRIKRFLVHLGDLITPRRRKVEVRNYLRAYTCCPPAFFLISITIAQIVVFSRTKGLEDSYWVSRLQFFGLKRWPELYRYVSYIFIHADEAHLISNLVIQLLCMPCEIVDHWRVWVIYITGAIWSAGFFYIFLPTGKLVGASGAICAILATNIAEIIMNWAEMPWRKGRLAIYGGYILITIMDILLNQFLWHIENPIGTLIAHAGGFFNGLLLGLILVKNLEVVHYEVVIRTICIIAYFIILGALIGLNIM